MWHVEITVVHTGGNFNPEGFYITAVMWDEEGRSDGLITAIPTEGPTTAVSWQVSQEKIDTQRRWRLSIRDYNFVGYIKDLPIPTALLNPPPLLDEIPLRPVNLPEGWTIENAVFHRVDDYFSAIVNGNYAEWTKNSFA